MINSPRANLQSSFTDLILPCCISRRGFISSAKARTESVRWGKGVKRGTTSFSEGNRPSESIKTALKQTRRDAWVRGTWSAWVELTLLTNPHLVKDEIFQHDPSVGQRKIWVPRSCHVKIFHLSYLIPSSKFTIFVHLSNPNLVFLDESFDLVRRALGKVMYAKHVLFTIKPRTSKVAVVK